MKRTYRICDLFCGAGGSSTGAIRAVEAMGFDDELQEYEFTGTAGEVTRQIGNAVACHTAEALVLAALEE